MGDRETHLRRGLDLLGRIGRVTSISALYETEPVGVADQPHFLNLAAGLETSLSPSDLLTAIKAIEVEVGRRPTRRWGPRVLDIDILLYDDLELESSTLLIPHQEMTKRAFVLVPLADIAPEVIHPRSGLSVRALLERVPEREGVRRVGPPPEVAT